MKYLKKLTRIQYAIEAKNTTLKNFKYVKNYVFAL